MVIGRTYQSISLSGSSSIQLIRSRWSEFHGQVPCDLNGDGVIETSGREENGCCALGKKYFGTPLDKSKTSFTDPAITSNLEGVSFGICVGSEDTGVDDVVSTTN